MGFEINPYDPCVANKTVNGTQMTVRWHADDLMISHTNHDNIMVFVKKTKDVYGENLREKVGTVDDYLGKTFDYSFDNKVQINMSQYITKVINNFPQEILEIGAAPAADNLYKLKRIGRSSMKKQPGYSIAQHIHFNLLPVGYDETSSHLTTQVQEHNGNDWATMTRVH